MTEKIKKLVDIAARLRNKESGCPWDLQQTQQSLTSHTIEETHELVHAIVNYDDKATCEELGDLLFHIVLYAQIASENNDINKRYDLNDVIDQVSEKMIRRHPHIFSDKTYANIDEQMADWDAIKAQEKLDNNSKKSKYISKNSTQNVSKEQMTDDERDLDINTSLFDSHIKALPAITQAVSVQKTMRKLGFDWDNAEQVVPKVTEELNELVSEMNQSNIDKNKLNDEFGDLLFACINLGRQLNIDADFALRSANAKFSRRSKAMIDLTGDKATFSQKTLEQKEKIWEDVKSFENIATKSLKDNLDK